MVVASLRCGLFYLRLCMHFLGSPYFLADCLLNGPKKVRLLEEYASDGVTVLGIILQQKTTIHYRCGFEMGRSYTILYTYKALDGATVVKPVVASPSEATSRQLLVRLLPDYPRSGYPKMYIDLGRTDNFDPSSLGCKTVVYFICAVALSFFVAFLVAGSIFDPHFGDDDVQGYPTCLDSDRPVCHMWIAFLLSSALLASIGYVGARYSFSKWKFLMVEEEFDSNAVRRALPQRQYVSVPTNENIPMAEVLSVVDENDVTSDVEMEESLLAEHAIVIEALENEMNVQSDAAPTSTTTVASRLASVSRRDV